MVAPENYRELLAFFKAGLTSGLINKDDVTEWADRFVLQETEPHIFFVELALIKSVNEGATYLSVFLASGGLVNGKAILGHLYKYLAEGNDVAKIIGTLRNLMDVAEFTESEESHIYRLDSAFDLACRNIYGDIESVKKETETFLSIYKDDSIENRNMWP